MLKCRSVLTGRNGFCFRTGFWLVSRAATSGSGLSAKGTANFCDSGRLGNLLLRLSLGQNGPVVGWCGRWIVNTKWN